MGLLEQLQHEIHDRYGCDAVHVESIPVREERVGRIVWEGNVEVFSLEGHPRARWCYAWSHVGDQGEIRYEIILAEGHVDSPRAAVRAAMVDESRRQDD